MAWKTRFVYRRKYNDWCALKQWGRRSDSGWGQGKETKLRKEKNGKYDEMAPRLSKGGKK